MKSNKISLFLSFLSVVLILNMVLPPVASANMIEKKVSTEMVLEIEGLLEEIEAERIESGRVSEEKVEILTEKLTLIEKSKDEEMMPFAGQTIDLGSGWNMRVNQKQLQQSMASVANYTKEVWKIICCSRSCRAHQEYKNAPLRYNRVERFSYFFPHKITKPRT